MVRIERVHEAAEGRLLPGPRLSGCGHRAHRRAVIGAIERDDFLPPGKRPGDAQRVLVRLGSAVGEKEDVNVARGDVCQFGTELRARLGRH